MLYKILKQLILLIIEFIKAIIGRLGLMLLLGALPAIWLGSVFGIEAGLIYLNFSNTFASLTALVLGTFITFIVIKYRGKIYDYYFSWFD